jgi:DNA ligase (NAD+)
MKNVFELKSLLIEANNLYRIGNPIMSDQEFDDNLEKLQTLISSNEFNLFKNSLHEEAGKIQHPFIMGSLDKIKYEEPETIEKFLNKYIKNLSISAKVDGISCRLFYHNGKLTAASTRGDGYFGQDLSNKINFVKHIPHEISCKEDIHIRGELVILKNDFATMSDEFANPRNACAGIMNRKEFDTSDISKVSFVAYTILGKEFSKEIQLEKLSEFGFIVTYNKKIIEQELSSIENISEYLFEIANIEHDYETDGLVISDIDYINEDEYRPDKQVAFKINQLVAETDLIDVKFEGPSKDGRFTPVGIVSPVELGGSMISRVTLHNLDFIEKMNLKYGSIINIIKSGDIIPKIVKVVSEGNAAIIPPTVCPSCGSTLVRKDIDVYCENKNCQAKQIQVLTHFIKKLDIKNASEKTIENFNIFSFDDLINFVADKKYKNQVKLEDELKSKMFNVSKQKLLTALNFTGLAEIQINKIIDFYGFENIVSKVKNRGTSYPEGIGELLIERFLESIEENLEIISKITSSSKYTYIENSNTNINNTKKEFIGSVCVTGSLNHFSRKGFEKFAVENGYEFKSGVTKGLTYLITNDTTSGSSKNKKAKELGIKILTEDEFIKLVKEKNISENVFDLNDL